ncbi:MAG TPA: DUF3570 domain-containing protein [Kofleriaceae bacterium]|jgi:hypothetical protein|nr:DUF3570 domain-containing protein [Kofleriaceae bacterium]
MQLKLAVAATLTLFVASPAFADGTLSARGVYYKERSTRVIQPMLDGMFDAGLHGIVTGHFLVDAITSASSGSGAAGTPFTEKRYEAGIGYTHEIDRFRLGADTKYSTESDYTSIYFGARGEADLAQKNATVGLGGGVSFDNVENTGAQSPMGGPMLVCDNNSTATSTSCPLRTISMFASASQIVSRDAVVGLTYDLSQMHGFQANPYRTVITDDGLTSERHPDDRLRQAIAVSGRYYLESSKTTLIGAYRYYRDSWKIRAQTPELRAIQQVGRDIDVALLYRYYTQTQSFFFEQRYASSDPTMNPTPYLTDDPKMSAFDSHTFEGKVGVLGDAINLDGMWAGARFEAILDYVIQHNRFGNAIIAHVALTVPFDY